MPVANHHAALSGPAVYVENARSKLDIDFPAFTSVIPVRHAGRRQFNVLFGAPGRSFPPSASPFIADAHIG